MSGYIWVCIYGNGVSKEHYVHSDYLPTFIMPLSVLPKAQEWELSGTVFWLQPPFKLRDSRKFQTEGKREGANVAPENLQVKMMTSPPGRTPCQNWGHNIFFWQPT